MALLALCMFVTLIHSFLFHLSLEENTVRDAASASTQAIVDVIPEAVFQNEYAAMLTRLATKEWFTARVSAAGLIPSAYPRLTTEQRVEHLNLFAQLCRDDTPMVRRIAAQHLGTMLEKVVYQDGRKTLADEGSVTIMLVPLYEELASNEQPVCSHYSCLSGMVVDFNAQCCSLKAHPSPLSNSIYLQS
jgi:hypothetical protein